MTSLELASWVLTGLTGVLAIATFYYAIITHKMLKSSRQSQKISQEQNSILSTHNILLKEQIETSKSQTQALFDQSQTLRYVVNAISDLPFDAHEIKNKIEKSKSLKK